MKYLVYEDHNVSLATQDESTSGAVIGKIYQGCKSPEEAIQAYMSEYYGSEPTINSHTIITAIQLPQDIDNDPEVIAFAEKEFHRT